MIPAIRFKGFSDDWEQRKGSEMFFAVSEKNHIDLPVLSASQEFGMIPRDKIGIEIKYNRNSLKNYKRVNPGQFVIHLRSFQGGFAWSNITGITSPAYTVIDFKNKDENNFSFWKNILTSSNFIKHLETVTYGIRDGRSISFKDFSTIKFFVPTVNEQEKIGILCTQLDKTIALHQRKLKIINALKTRLLASAFPNNDETKDIPIPSLRFQNFNGYWKECELKECFDFSILSKPLSRSMLNYTKGEIMCIHYGDILIHFPSILDVKNTELPRINGGEKSKYEKDFLQNGDLVFADTAEDETVGKAVEMSGITNENVVSGLHTIVARAKEMNGKFYWGYFINSETYHRQIFRLMQGSKVSSISKENLQKTSVYLPISIQEQENIGDFFKKIDEIINISNVKVEHFQNIKKAFLQKMFI